METPVNQKPVGLLLHSFALRFLFLFFLLICLPWPVMGSIPGLDILLKGLLMAVEWSNQVLFQTYDTLVLPNGSSDTSWHYTFLKLMLLVSLVLALVWTLWKRHKPVGNGLTVWFLLLLRYELIFICFYYGIIKLFGQQMPFPSMSLMATPVGDLHPMRLGWVFMGYSFSYQFFAGLLEVVAGLFLFYRRTISLGIVLSLFVFGQVLLMNLSFDVPVKIVAGRTFIIAVILFLYDSKRYLNFFILNQTTLPATVFHVPLPTRRQRIMRIVLKSVFFFFIFIGEFATALFVPPPHVLNHPIPPGVYEVTHFIANKDTLDVATNAKAWKDIIFDLDGTGSVQSSDTVFRQRYGRGYFKCVADTLPNRVQFKTVSPLFEEKLKFTMQWEKLDQDRYLLKGRLHQDQIQVQIKNTNRFFPLTRKPFHWRQDYVP